MLINKANLAAHYKGFKALFQGAFNKVEPNYTKVAMHVPSGNSSEDYGWLGSFPKMREWLGARAIRSLKLHSHTIKNKKFEATVAVTRENLEDDNIGIYSPMMQDMGHEARIHPDDLVFALLATAFSELCYDGQYMVDTDHPMAGSTHSNDGGGGGDPWFLIDNSRALKPLIYQERIKPEMQFINSPSDEHAIMEDEFLFGIRSRDNAGFGLWQLIYGSKDTLSAAHFATGKQAMREVTDDSGNPLGIQPRLLVVGPSNEAAALELIKTEKLANGASNINHNAVEVFVTPYL